MAISQEIITGADFRRMIAGAYDAFVREHEYINRLNVFPVPDGDTGSNMLLTLGAISLAMGETTGNDIGRLSRRAADSAIMGARGNSGVIMAQIFRGLARGLAGKETATASEIGKAFQYGVLYAYRAVARPVEGTILTVAKGIAKGTRRAVREGRGFADVLAAAVVAGKAELARTPELLPVLKQAGVVDAGGQGLIVLLKGCLEGLQGLAGTPEADAIVELKPRFGGESLMLTHPYCTEFIVGQPQTTIAQAKRQLDLLGDSLVLAEADNAFKVHMHTAHPGRVLEIALSWGSLHDIKIDNMSFQNKTYIDKQTAPNKKSDENEVVHWGPSIKVNNMADQQRQDVSLVANPEPLAVISVSPGTGLGDIMRKLGAGGIIDGGQTMNPSVEAFIDAVHRGQAESYIILPNNSNIVLAAMQAKKLLGDKVEVVPTRSVPEGLAALLAFDATDDLGHNRERMSERLKTVKAAAVSVAVRAGAFAGSHIDAGTFIGIVDNEVVAAGTDLPAALHNTLALLVTPSTELISLYYGAGLIETEVQRLADEAAVAWPKVSVELYYGGQPHYHFIISVE